MYSPQVHKNKTQPSAEVCFVTANPPPIPQPLPTRPPRRAPKCAEGVQECAPEPRAPGGRRGVGGRVKGVAGDQRCTEIGFAPAGAWPRLSHPTRGGAFGRCGELSHCSRAQRPPAGWGSFHPGSRGSSAPRAPALRPRPLVRHLSSERHCQQPRLASWTTPKGTRGLGPKRSKQGGFIPVPFGGDLEQNRKVWGGGGEDSALPSAGFYKRFIWGASSGPGGRGSGVCLRFLGCYSVLEELLSRQISQQASQRSPEWEPISNADVRFVCWQV